MMTHCISFILGNFLFFLFYRFKRGSFEALAQEIIRAAEKEAEYKRKNLDLELKEARYEQLQTLKAFIDEEQKKITKEKETVIRREEKLEHLIQIVEKKLKENEKKEELLKKETHVLEQEKHTLFLLQKKSERELERVSSLSMEEAKDLLFKKIEEAHEPEISRLISENRKLAKEKAEEEARRIIITAINRIALPCVSEMTTTTLNLPEEMKGRIIGREGRNIRTLEQATGVNILMDDIPGALVISGFDPIRKHIAKKTLLELLQDGRIYPTRILEVVDKVKQILEKEIHEYGEDAAMKCSVFNLHPVLISYLGKLQFRTSLGQHLLNHSIEVSHIMGRIAAELGLNIETAKRMGLLHDIGKAASHEKEASHALVGHEIALKYGEGEIVANGVGCHHNEMAPLSLEASLVSTADAISSGRLGARNGAIEEYIKRLHILEALSSQYPGVEKAYAFQAGREICVTVSPTMLDDLATEELAKTLAKKIEEETDYFGRIKVTVIRVKKSIEYAT
jgi:ribonucrease Y